MTDLFGFESEEDLAPIFNGNGNDDFFVGDLQGESHNMLSFSYDVSPDGDDSPQENDKSWRDGSGLLDIIPIKKETQMRQTQPVAPKTQTPAQQPQPQSQSQPQQTQPQLTQPQSTQIQPQTQQIPQLQQLQLQQQQQQLLQQQQLQQLQLQQQQLQQQQLQQQQLQLQQIPPTPQTHIAQLQIAQLQLSQLQLHQSQPNSPRIPNLQLHQSQPNSPRSLPQSPRTLTTSQPNSPRQLQLQTSQPNSPRVPPQNFNPPFGMVKKDPHDFNLNNTFNHSVSPEHTANGFNLSNSNNNINNTNIYNNFYFCSGQNFPYNSLANNGLGNNNNNMNMNHMNNISSMNIINMNISNMNSVNNMNNLNNLNMNSMNNMNNLNLGLNMNHMSNMNNMNLSNMNMSSINNGLHHNMGGQLGMNNNGIGSINTAMNGLHGAGNMVCDGNKQAQRRFSNPPVYSVGNFSSVQQIPYSSSNYNEYSGSSSGSSYSSSVSEDDSEFSFCDEHDEELRILEIASKFTLPSSKSPIIEAMAFCAVHNWGIGIVQNCGGSSGNGDSMEESAKVVLLVKNFTQYCRFSRLICSKRHPTNNEGARIKALRRWFVKFPKKKERKNRESFQLEVKPEYAQKVSEMIDRYMQ